ncbi:hypothetical protein SCHPADRAFT_894755 [Schizopora paradoxa]|uniref:Protein kinase domain-containing protein n=1 Tax=Schizopora paradoxa TaxID=27342 RepID=A0A0H2R689_9AGAM|nr:hypothetical protein SCHPADRAFT_894755 [Schizopora paradoxa]
MEVVSTTVEAIGFLLRVLEFYHQYDKAPGDLKASLQRTKDSSMMLRTWVNVFKRFDWDENPTLRELFPLLRSKLDSLQKALDDDRDEVVKWMEKIGYPVPSFEEDTTLDSPRASSLDISRKKSISFLSIAANSLNRAKYIRSGSLSLETLEKNIRDYQSEVAEMFLATIVATTAKSIRPTSDPSSCPPMSLFVVDARKRREDKVSIITLDDDDMSVLYEPGDGNKFKVDVVDNNVHRDRQIQRITILKAPSPLAALRPGTYVSFSRTGQLNDGESMDLARLFKAEEKKSTPGSGRSGSESNFLDAFPEDGDMLRCCAVVRPTGSLYMEYIFKVPHGISKFYTLRSLLLDNRAYPDALSVPLFSIADRIKLSIRLATAVLVVHSLGLVHKRINPDAILVVDAANSDHFPKKLGYPYLVGFHLSRHYTAGTTLSQDDEELSRIGIYFHPRDQARTRSEPYTMTSDIFSLGVCMLEIALWTSLFIVDNGTYVPNPVDRLKMLDDKRYSSDMDSHTRAYMKRAELIRIAKAEIPRTLGSTFAEVVVDCLQAGSPDSLFPERTEEVDGVGAGDAVGDVPNGVLYLNVVLKKLRVVYDGVSGTLFR